MEWFWKGFKTGFTRRFKKYTMSLYDLGDCIGYYFVIVVLGVGIGIFIYRLVKSMWI